MHRTRNITKLTIILISILACFDLIGMQLELPDSTRANKLSSFNVERFADSLLLKYLANSEYPNAAISVVMADSISFLKGYGWEDQGRSTVVDPRRTIFSEASIAKVFVAVAIMQLVEQGKLELHDPVNKYLSKFKLDNNKTTIWNLLTHTSGLDYMMSDSQYPNEPLMPMGEYFRRNISKTVFEPGTQINYSNHGMALAGHIVELVSNMEFKDYTQKFIFDPLEMTQSTFEQPIPKRVSGKFVSERFDQIEVIRPYPAGSLVSTGLDMANFMTMLLNKGVFKGKKVLAANSIRQILSRQFSQDSRMPGIGLAFFESEIDGLQVFVHTGSKDHFAIVAVIPQLKLGVHMAIAAGHRESALRYDFVKGTIKGIKGTKYVSETRVKELLISQKKEYLGSYRFNNIPQSSYRYLMGIDSDLGITVDKDGGLVADGIYTMDYIGNDMFRVKDGSFIFFERDVTKKISNLYVSSPLRDSVSLRKLNWWEEPIVHFSIFIMELLILLIFSVLLIIMCIKTLVKGKVYFKNIQERSIWTITSLSVLTMIAVPITAAILILNTVTKSDVRLTEIVDIALVELNIGVGFGLIALLFLPIVFFKEYFGKCQRIAYYIYSIGLVPLYWSMFYWNLL